MNTLELIPVLLASTGFWELIRYFFEKRSRKNRMLLGIAHALIIRDCEIYLERGWISHAEYDDFIKYLYEPYKAHGANGLAEKLKQEVDKLPSEERSADERLE